MNGAWFIMGVGLGIASMAFIFILLLLRKIEITEERILKILGEDAENIKKAKSDEELKALIRGLTKKQRTKLKTLFESQDLQDAMYHIKKHVIKVDPQKDLNANQD